MVKLSTKFLVIFFLALSYFAYSKDNAAKVYDPCQILASEDIQAVFPDAQIKTTAHDAKAANPLGTRRCFWEASQTDMKFVQLSITSDAETKTMKTAEQFENNRQFIENVKTVSEVGDGAYYGGSGLKAGAGLHVLVKNKGVLINIIVGLGFGNSDEQMHLEIEKSLAKKVVERL